MSVQTETARRCLQEAWARSPQGVLGARQETGYARRIPPEGFDLETAYGTLQALMHVADSLIRAVEALEARVPTRGHLIQASRPIATPRSAGRSARARSP